MYSHFRCFFAIEVLLEHALQMFLRNVPQLSVVGHKRVYLFDKLFVTLDNCCIRHNFLFQFKLQSIVVPLLILYRIFKLGDLLN